MIVHNNNQNNQREVRLNVMDSPIGNALFLHIQKYYNHPFGLDLDLDLDKTNKNITSVVTKETEDARKI